MLWSVPGTFSRFVPAVPSTTGVADVFAFQNATVQAITSDGVTASTADAGNALDPYSAILPDFQGGLILMTYDRYGFNVLGGRLAMLMSHLRAEVTIIAVPLLLLQHRGRGAFVALGCVLVVVTHFWYWCWLSRRYSIGEQLGFRDSLT